MIIVILIALAVVLGLVDEILGLRRKLARERRANASLRREVGAWRRRDLYQLLVDRRIVVELVDESEKTS